MKNTAQKGIDRMGIIYSDKELSKDKIKCGESFKVKLSLTAEPDISSNPVDIVLILDRSQSMAGSPLANLKNGAYKFIDIIDEATDGVKDGQIGLGSRIGIVSFSDTAVQDTQLITSVADLKSAVNALTAGGRTNHADAFSKAVNLFNPASSNGKIIVMFTDGRTTIGVDPEPIAAAAKAQGITIYCIGLSGNGGIDETALDAWASDPDSSYVAITPNDEELENLFEKLAENISKTGAKDIVVKDTVFDCFKITEFDKPSKGTAKILDDTSIEWKIDELGTKNSEGAFLEFTVQHVGPCSGKVEVNEEITYKDKEGNHVNFPSPEITVECDEDLCVEECHEPKDITINGCEASSEFDAGTIGLNSLGRILNLSVTIRNVCPHKRVALAVILTETDDYGNEFNRGIKFITVPAHTKDGCHDIKVKCIKFVLPEELDVSGTPCSICDKRKFKARFIAQYIDTDFECTEVVI